MITYLQLQPIQKEWFYIASADRPIARSIYSNEEVKVFIACICAIDSEGQFRVIQTIRKRETSMTSKTFEKYCQEIATHYNCCVYEDMKGTLIAQPKKIDNIFA